MEGFKWRKSSRSNGSGGDCVEVADNLPEVVGVRDSKDPDGPVLRFSREAWRDLVEAVKRDEL
jgi:hypothetical protein